MANWHLAPSLVELFAEVNAKWPHRTKNFDGSIGDAAHAARQSEHNPDSHGTVHAIDITKEGINVNQVLKSLIGDPRVWYVIHNGTIWSRTYNWRARKYTGADSHAHHIHVSIRLNSEAENNKTKWFSDSKPPVVTPPKPTPKPEPKPTTPGDHKPGSRTLSRNDGKNPEGDDVKLIQRFFGIKQDGVYGPKTEQKVKDWQMSMDLPADGDFGPKSWSVLRRVLKNF